jgi:hypothetical protein
MRYASFLALMFLAPWLVACGANDDELVARAPRELIGREVDQIISCAGPPSERKAEPGGEALIYRAEIIRHVAIDTPELDTPLAQGNFGGDYGATYQHRCNLIFHARDGRVTDVAIEGHANAGRSSNRACGAVLKRCLK